MIRTFASLESNQLQTACVDQSWGFCIWSGQAGKVVHRKCIHEGKWISFDSEKPHSVLNCTTLFVSVSVRVTCSVTSSINGPEQYVSGSFSLGVFLGQTAHSCWVTSYRSPTHWLHTQVGCPSAFKSARVIQSQVDSSERLSTWHSHRPLVTRSHCLVLCKLTGMYTQTFLLDRRTPPAPPEKWRRRKEIFEMSADMFWEVDWRWEKEELKGSCSFCFRSATATRYKRNFYTII